MSKEKKFTLNDILKIIDDHLKNRTGRLFISLDPYEMVDICQRLGVGYKSKVTVANPAKDSYITIARCDSNPDTLRGFVYTGAIFSTLTEKDLKEVIKSRVNATTYGSSITNIRRFSNTTINSNGGLPPPIPYPTQIDLDLDDDEDDPWIF